VSFLSLTSLRKAFPGPLSYADLSNRVGGPYSTPEGGFLGLLELPQRVTELHPKAGVSRTVWKSREGESPSLN
jgi:hypothetical protein